MNIIKKFFQDYVEKARQKEQWAKVEALCKSNPSMRQEIDAMMCRN